MEMIWLPESIREKTEGQRFSENDIGMSGSRVLMGEDMVLKIGSRNGEWDNERRVMLWAKGKQLPLPELLGHEEADGNVYFLMSRVRGKMLCGPDYMRNPALQTELAAGALQLLWGTDLSGCPCDQRLDKKLRAARRQVELGLVDLDNVEPETFGEGGFRDPEELLDWLEKNRPEEDVVLSHGDFCLPNVLARGDRLSGLIDCGRMGLADRWQDIALCLRSMRHNYDGYYGGPAYGGWSPELLLDRLGVPLDEGKLRYYLLLDELF